MASSASDLLKLELQGVGDNPTTWGTVANTVFSRMEEAIAGYSSISLASLGGAGYTLDDTQYVENTGTTAESHLAILKATGTLTASENVILPARTKHTLFWNATSGAFTVTVKTSGGTGVTVPQGYVQWIFCDGTNVEAAGSAFSTNGALNMAGNSIFDTNGNELIKFTETASAVNEITVVNAATGNGPGFSATGGDTNIDLVMTPKGTGQLKQSTTPVALTGKHAVPIPAVGMYTTTTNGAAAGATETSTNAVMIKTWDFDTATDEYVQFQVPMPASWNEGTVTFKAYWSHASTTTNFGVAWGLQGLALGDSDAIDAAFGTGVVVTDTGGTTDDIFITGESSAVTIAGTPAAGDIVIFRLYRDVSDAGDTMAIDARLHGITLYLTTDTGNDA